MSIMCSSSDIGDEFHYILPVCSLRIRENAIYHLTVSFINYLPVKKPAFALSLWKLRTILK